MELGSIISRREALGFIAKSSIYGNLGLFIGAGFSMAIMNDEDSRAIALSWIDLIQKVAKKYDINAKEDLKEGQSLPELVTSLIERIANKQKKEYSLVALEFKHHISTFTTYYPTRDKRQIY